MRYLMWWSVIKTWDSRNWISGSKLQKTIAYLNKNSKKSSDYK